MKKSNVYIGLDPSIAHSGITFVNTLTKEIFQTEIQYKSSKSPAELLKIINSIVNDHNKLIIDALTGYDALNYEKVVFTMELDLAYGTMYQAELFALDTLLMHTLNEYKGAKKFIFNTMYLHNLVRPITVGNKEDLVLLAEDIKDYLSNFGYTFHQVYHEKTRISNENISTNPKVKRYPYKETMSSGEADSLLLALSTIVNYDEDTELYKLLKDKYPKLYKKNLVEVNYD